MPLVELRPNGVQATTGSPVIVGGSASHNAAQADSSDTTYTELDGGAESVYLDFDTVAVPALAQIRHVYARVRIQTSTNDALLNQMDYRLFQVIDGTTYNLPQEFPVTSTSWTDFYGTVHTTNPRTGLPWTQADIDVLGVAETRFSSATRPYRFAAAYIYVSYNEAPVATVTAPTGTVTTSTRPSTTWTYSDPDNNDQERYRVKVFSAAQYGAGGFSPETSTATWDSGEVLSSATSVVTGTDLANNTTYRSYVKVADVGSSGRYGAWGTGPTFTVTLDPPAVPTVAATVDTSSARVSLAVQGRDNMLTANQASIETDLTGLMSWFNVTRTRVTTQFLHGGASLSMSSNAAGSMGVHQDPPSIVVPGQTYTARASFRAATTSRSVHMRMSWRSGADGSGTISEIDGPVIADLTSGWVEAALTATAPAGAQTLYIGVIVVGTGAAGEVHYVDQISVAPSHINLLSEQNASFESTTGIGWAANTNATTERTTAQSKVGLASLSATSVGAGDLQIVSPTIPVKIGAFLTAVASFRAKTVTRRAALYLDCYDTNFTYLGTRGGTGSAAGQTKTNEWLDLSFAFTPPTNTAHVRFGPVVEAATAAGEVHYVDAVALNEGTSTLWTPGKPGWSRGGYTESAASQRVAVERSLNGGTTWTTVTGAGSVDLTDPTQTAALHDYEAPSGVPVIYRARTSGLVSGQTLASSNSDPSSATLVVGAWWLIDPSALVPNLVVNFHEAELNLSRPENQTIFRPLGRTRAIVQADTLGGEEGELTLAFLDAATYATFETLRGTQRTLYLQTPLGLSLYVRLGAVRHSSLMLGGQSRTTPKRIVSIGFVEVDRPV